MDLERLNTAIENTIREPDGVVHQSKHRDDQALIYDAARAYRDLLANGERVEPDYEAAEVAIHGTMADVPGHPESRKHCNCRLRARFAVDAAIGDRLLISSTEED